MFHVLVNEKVATQYEKGMVLITLCIYYVANFVHILMLDMLSSETAHLCIYTFYEE